MNITFTTQCQTITLPIIDTIDSHQCLYGNRTGSTHIQYHNTDGTPSLSGYATNTNLNNYLLNHI